MTEPTETAWWLSRPALAGSVVTAVFLLLPLPYPYAPVAGGVVAAVVARGPLRRRARAGAVLGAYMLLWGVVLAVLAAVPSVSLAGSGLDAIVASMEGVGPKTVVFYAVLAWFVAVYSGLVGTLSSTVTGVAVTRLRQVLR